MRSPIYWHPAVYRAVLRLLYGPALDARWRAVSRLVRPGETVIDLCAGDGEVRRHLPPSVRYLAVDANATFVRSLWAQHVEARLVDVRTEAIPRGDVVMMLGSLYHFVPEQVAMVERMKAAAGRLAIVVEPAVNLSSGSGLLGRWSRRLTDSGVPGSYLGRLGPAELDALALATHPTHTELLERERVLGYERPRAAGTVPPA